MKILKIGRLVTWYFHINNNFNAKERIPSNVVLRTTLRYFETL